MLLAGRLHYNPDVSTIQHREPSRSFVCTIVRTRRSRLLTVWTNMEITNWTSRAKIGGIRHSDQKSAVSIFVIRDGAIPQLCDGIHRFPMLTMRNRIYIARAAFLATVVVLAGVLTANTCFWIIERRAITFWAMIAAGVGLAVVSLRFIFDKHPTGSNGRPREKSP